MNSTIRAGDWVRVRTKEEILASLDEAGCLEGLPFMPEMLEFCGKRIRVFKRAHKTCDPPNGLSGRRMQRAVHLEDVRCTGSAHGDCQARCLLFWKEAWLEREGDPRQEITRIAARCTEQDLSIRTESNREHAGGTEPPRYACQSTLLARATEPLRWWDLRQYIEDYTSGNACLSRIAAALFFFLYHQLVSSGIGIGSALRWAYDTVQGWRGRPPYPIRTGRIMRGAPTPSVKLGVQPGELVRIKPYEQILATIDEDGNNRGMFFDAEMAPFCGGTYRVLGRINKIIDESSGYMRILKNECIVLDGVVCKACYAKHRRLCPRSIYPYWREVWLERVENAGPGTLAGDEVSDERLSRA